MPTRQELVQSYLQSGMREHARGNADGAREAYQQALAVAPDHPQALNLLGTALLQLGQSGQAAERLERAARALRNDAGVLANLAQAYFALRRFDDAHATFRKASRLDPRESRFQLGMANSLAMQGRLAEAGSLLERLASRHPGDPLVWFNLGNVLRDGQRLEEASQCYVKALAADPRSVPALNNLGGVLHALYRFDEAEREYRACIALAPDHAAAHYNLASVLIDAGRFRDAEAVCREIIVGAPEDALAHGFLGDVLTSQGRLREALACRRHEARLAPRDAGIAAGHAAALAASADLAGALREFDRALALDPDPASARHSRSAALLAAGCLADGWVDYAYRPAFVRFREQHPGIRLSRSLPPALDGTPIFLLPEQGLGDELFFLRFAQPLSAAGARVTCRASDRIRSLLDRVACLSQAVDAAAPLPPGHTVMLIGDLPHALSDRGASPLPAAAARENGEFDGPRLPLRISVFWPAVPPPLPLPPLDTRLAAMRQRLAGTGSPPYVGVSWRGGTPPREQRRGAAWSLHKEIGIEPLAAALRGSPGTVLALQRQPASGEIEGFSRALGRRVHDFSDLNDDLEGMLALLALIDEYVGVSNTNMHLRAGTGRAARVLVPCPAEWRWMAAGNASPWFPGFTVYRQSQQGDWDAALSTLGRDLATTVNDWRG